MSPILRKTTGRGRELYYELDDDGPLSTLTFDVVDIDLEDDGSHPNLTHDAMDLELDNNGFLLILTFDDMNLELDDNSSLLMLTLDDTDRWRSTAPFFLALNIHGNGLELEVDGSFLFSLDL